MVQRFYRCRFSITNYRAFCQIFCSRFRRSDNETVEDPHTDADLREKEFGGSGDNNFEEGVSDVPFMYLKEPVM